MRLEKRPAADDNTPAPPSKNRRDSSPNRDSDDDDESSWQMRCRCKMDHGDGDTLECAGCKTWQHWACMGLNKHSDISKYKCEICVPRKLPVTKAEAIKMQKKILEKLNKAGKEDKKRERKKRKSEPVEQDKNQVRQAEPRNSAPMTTQPVPPVPAVHHTPLLNEYSRLAANLLSSLPQTTGADTLLEYSRRHKKAKRMFVMENVEALVTTEVVSIRQVILKVNGYVSMASEVKRQPGGGNCIFMYDGLMKGTSGEDTGDHQELVCIDAKKNGNDSRFTRRSCLPNSVLKHVLGSQTTLGIMLVATEDIQKSAEVTLPFDADWRQSDAPLECAKHIKQLHLCPFENERLRYAAERCQVEDDRRGKTREMDLVAEAERLDQEKAKRDEARKKKETQQKEAEKKPKREAEEKIVADIKVEEQEYEEEVHDTPELFQQGSMIHHIQQLNDYSLPVFQFLVTHSQTIGADYVIEDSRRNKKAFVLENLNCLVTSESCPSNTILLEINGKVKMAEEEGTGINTFLYTGLQNPIKIEANNDSKYTRRSCKPNSTLRHAIGTGYQLGVFVVSVKDIQKGNEATLPFDEDDKETPCAEHWNNRELCDRR